MVPERVKKKKNSQGHLANVESSKNFVESSNPMTGEIRKRHKMGNSEAKNPIFFLF